MSTDDRAARSRGARPCGYVAVSILILATLPAAAPAIELSKVDADEFGSSVPSDIAGVAGQVVAAATSALDREIHIVDPLTVDPLDPANESTIVDVDPNAGSFPMGIAEAGDLAFFSALMTLANRELYVVDPLNPGAGATNIEINPAGDSNPTSIAEVMAAAGDLAVMAATTATDGTELFIVDPANLPAGETLVDVNPGPGSSNPTRIAGIDERAVFRAANDGTDFELHVVDPHNPGLGSTEIDINAGGSSNPKEIIGVADLAVFAAFDGTDTEVFVVDPSMPGLGATKVDVSPGPAGSNPQYFTAVGNLAVFRASDFDNGIEVHILDPTNPGAGTTVVNINENPFASSLPEGITAVAGRAVFNADDGTGMALHVIDPTDPDERFDTINVNPKGTAHAEEITDVGGRAVFRATVDGDTELYVVDPLYPEFGWVKVDIDPKGSSSPDNFADVAGRLAFSATVGSETKLFILSFDTRWDNDSSGAWDNAANWRGGIAPRMIDDVVIAPDNGLTVTGPADDTVVSSVTVGATSGTATLALAGGAIRAHTATINVGGRLTGSGTLSTDAGPITNFGTIDVTSGLQLDGGPLDNEQTGVIQADEGDAVVFSGMGNTNLGEINLFGGVVTFTHDLLNERMGLNNGLISGRGRLEVGGGLTNDGAMAFSGGLTDILGDVDNTASGQIVNAGGGTLTFFDDVVNNGDVRTTTGSTTVFFGAYSGGGTTSGGGTASFEGDLSPGNSPGLLAFGTSVELRPGSSLIIELGGTERGAEYDALDVEGTVSLAGTLDVALTDFGNGLFQPQAGDSFLLISSEGGITGQFSQIDLPALDSLLQWQLDTSVAELLLEVAIAGDFNGDGTVGAADYVVWRNSEGLSGLVLPADADGDGTVGQADYDRWRANFGLTAAAVNAARGSTIPEPAAAVLLLLGLSLAPLRYHAPKFKRNRR